MQGKEGLTVTCSLGGEVEDLELLGVAEDVVGEDLGLVLRGAGEVGEEDAALPPAAPLAVDADLPGLHLHLLPVSVPRLPVLHPEALDLRLAVAVPGEGVGVRVQTHAGAGEGGGGGEASHQNGGVSWAELIAGLTLVRPEHLLALHREGEEVFVGLLPHDHVLHVIVEDEAIPGPHHHGAGGGVDDALELLLQPRPWVHLGHHRLNGRGVYNGTDLSLN